MRIIVHSRQKRYAKSLFMCVHNIDTWFRVFTYYVAQTKPYTHILNSMPVMTLIQNPIAQMNLLLLTSKHTNIMTVLHTGTKMTRLELDNLQGSISRRQEKIAIQLFAPKFFEVPFCLQRNILASFPGSPLTFPGSPTKGRTWERIFHTWTRIFTKGSFLRKFS